MSDRIKWAASLEPLVERNFYNLKCYKAAMGKVPKPFWKSQFFYEARKRYLFAMELNREIKFLGGEPSRTRMAQDPNLSRTVMKDPSKGDFLFSLKHCIKMEKKNLKKYEKILSTVNEGSTREILIRHKSEIKASIKELELMKAQTLVNNEQKHRRLSLIKSKNHEIYSNANTRYN